MKKREFIKIFIKSYPLQIIAFMAILFAVVIVVISSFRRPGTRYESMTVVDVGYLTESSINWDAYEKESDITGIYVKLRDKQDKEYLLKNPDNDTYVYCRGKKKQDVEVKTNTTRNGLFDCEVEIIKVEIPLWQ